MYMYIQSSDYDEYTDSEDELGPRLKPVFVRKWVHVHMYMYIYMYLYVIICIMYMYMYCSPQLKVAVALLQYTSCMYIGNVFLKIISLTYS